MAIGPVGAYRASAFVTFSTAATPAAPSTPAGPTDGFFAGVKNTVARVRALADAQAQGVTLGYSAGLRGEDAPELPSTGDAGLDAARARGLEAGHAQGLKRHDLLQTTEHDGFFEARDAANAGQQPPTASESDAELRAAHQRGLDAGYAQGIEDQKAICFEEGKKAGRGEQPALSAPEDLSTELAQAQWAAYSQGLEAGKLEAAPPGAEQALAFANDPPRNPQNPDGVGQGWAYWCLGMVRSAYQSAGNAEAAERLRAPDAATAYQHYADAGRVQTEGVPPRGAVVFFEWGTEGHIGISQGGGTYVGTTEDGNTGVFPYTQGGSKYLGWAMP